MEMRAESTSPGGHHHPHLPPGFRFHPTDEELVVHYLKRKAASAPLPVSIIAEIDLYKHDPWELPAKASFGENEWYFFSPRDRKYPNGARPNRAATSGYWKATGTDKPIRAGNKIVGVKKALVFYGGKPLKGVKTNWIMHEYRLADCPAGSSSGRSKIGGIHDCGIERGGGERRKKVSLRLDDWVLCRIYQKNATQRPADQDMHPDPAVFPTIVPTPRTTTSATTFLPFTNTNSDVHKSSTYSAMLAHDEAFYEGLFASTAPFGARQPELSRVLLDCNRTLDLPLYQSRSAVAGGERDEEGCGQVGGYSHNPVVETYHVAGVNWNT